jgi:phage-related protein
VSRNKIQTSRNIPKNIQEEAQTAQTLGGIVSQKTQLSVLSIVPDVDAEIKQIDKEKQDSQDQAIKRIYPGNTQEEQQKESQEGGLNEQS